MNRPASILIADDEALGRTMLEALLTSEGFTLWFAENGQQALDLAIAHVPDLILLDVMMPGMDGFEVTRRLRARPDSAEVPIILVTALDDRDSRLQGIEAGADDFITKPFDRIELRARVRSITRLNRYRRLMAERSQFTWVVEHSEDGYVLVDRDGQIRFANERARIYLGLPGDQELGGAFLDWAQRQYQLEPPEQWSDAPSAGAARFLVRPETSTATAFWLRVDQLNADPHHGGQVIRLRDVTAEMTSVRNTRTFHSLVAHKLRTPLNHLLFGLQLLSEDVAGMERTEIENWSRIAFDAAERLHQQVEGVLDYIGTKRVLAFETSFTLGDLPGLVKTIGESQGLAGISVAVGDDVREERVRLPAQTLELMLIELLDNAKKFHPNGTPQVELHAGRSDAAMANVRISDDGLTLSPEQLVQMWSPHYQGEKHHTGEVPGMGLGLALVANVVWSVGGRCRTLNRNDGPGIIVEITLPLYASTQELTAAPSISGGRLVGGGRSS